MRRFTYLLASVCLLTFVVFVSSGTAFAAEAGRTSTNIALSTCYASSCYDKDPYAYGCDTGDATHGAAYVADSRNVYNPSTGQLAFVVDNWYSPKCAANWNVTTLKTVTYVIWIDITNSNGQRTCYYSGSSCSLYSDLKGSPLWTNMVDGTVTAQACALYDFAGIASAQTYCGNWV